MATELSRDNAKRREIESLYPELTWYYGIGPLELSKLPRWLKQIYVDALGRLIASDQLRAIEAATYPHATEGDRDRIHQRWTRMLPKKLESEGLRVQTKEDLVGFGALAGVGVVFEPKKKPDEAKV